MKPPQASTRGGVFGKLHVWKERLRIAAAFRGYIRPHRPRLTAAILLSTAVAALRLLEPWPLQIVIDHVILDNGRLIFGIDPLALAGGNRYVLIAWAAGSVLAIAAAAGSASYAQSVLLAGIGQDIVRELRQDVFHQLQRLSLPFHRKTPTGDLLMRLTGDMILLREMILSLLVSLSSHLLLLVSALVLMVIVSPRLTAITLLLAPLLYLVFRLFRVRMIAAARKQRKREGRLAASLQDVLLAVPMIQAFTAEPAEDERFRRINKRSARAGLRAARLEAGMQRTVELLLGLGTALVLWAGTREILHGALTPGVFLVFLAYLRGVFKPIRGLSKVAERTARASAASERILEVLHARREVRDSRDAVAAPRFRGEIRFDGVDYRYEDGTSALEGIDLVIRPGQQVALVGPTGAGKSTFVGLILRFQNPTAGRVRIDGVPIKRYTLESLRRQIAWLPQEPYLLGGTVRETLLYGRPEASDAELWSALRAVGMDEMIRALPKGLDGPIRPRGLAFSGGEKQRLAIARTLLRDAPVVLLDEPTTGLDARSEKDVLRSLDTLKRGRTAITIAHRVATIRSADRVLVLDDGRLVEDGAPQELLARDSLLRIFAEIQGLPLSGIGNSPPRAAAPSHRTSALIPGRRDPREVS